MECFSVYRNEINGRLDCYFYRPEYTKRDRKIKSISNKKLGDYIISISGGATPDIKQSEKYYTDADKGIPFLRVQNVTPEGLNIADVKYINKETHEGLLKRSQVKEFNLLTKITGVGRMAVSSVAPKGFIGNINQHLVVVETEGEKVSKVLANFLNSDVGEKLATRRSTGGTRPALDYNALKSIPIVFKLEIVEIMDNAYTLKKQKESEAQKLLDSINDYVLSELGIKLPELKYKMCFVVWADEIRRKRIDPQKYTDKPKAILRAIGKSKYGKKELSSLIVKTISGEWGKNPLTGVSNDYILCNVLRNTNFDNQYNLNLENVAKRRIFRNKFKNIKLKKDDILIEKSGGSPIQPVGRIAIIEDLKGDYTFSNFLQLFRINQKECVSAYLFAYLKAVYSLNYMEYLQNQTTGIKNLIMEEYLLIPVPLPPLEIQNGIADEVKVRMQKAKQLQKEAKEVLEEAKERVERIILGEEEI